MPNGALVISRSGDGPIRTVIDGIGEKFTHTAISHGSTARISHAAMQTPARSPYPVVCSQPVNVAMLNQGWPGPSRVEAGATWAYYFNDGNNVEVSWQSGNRQLDDWAFFPADTFPARWKFWPANSNRGSVQANFMQGLMMGNNTSHSGTAPVFWYSASVYSPVQRGYDFTQFMDMKKADFGFANCVESSACSRSVCSTFAASNSWKADIGWVDHRTYPNTLVNQATQSLYNSVYNQCRSGLGYWGNLFTSVACLTTDSLCTKAANQIVNSFVTGGTGDTGATWRNVVANPNQTARSISPDCIGGWTNGRGVSGCPISGAGSSSWGFDITHPAQFNGPGSVYSCWY